MANPKGHSRVYDRERIKPVEVTKCENCLDCGKKISQKKFADQEGLCDKCYGPFMDDTSHEEYPEESF